MRIQRKELNGWTARKLQVFSRKGKLQQAGFQNAEKGHSDWEEHRRAPAAEDLMPECLHC